MLWFFERDGERIRYEVRPSAPHSGFELIIHFPNGLERLELFRTHSALLRRQAELDQQFTEQGWVEYTSLDEDGATGLTTIPRKPPLAS